MRTELEVRELGKRFGATQALAEVSFSLQGGRILALLGENGAGKSTLIKILCGVHQADTGQVRLSGQAVQFRTPAQAIRAGIVQVPQELRLVPALSVAHNILLGQLPTRRIAGLPGWLDRAAMRARAQALLADLQIDLDPDVPAGRLSFAERQLVVIARAFAHDAKVLILDEPTASLEKREVDRLFEVVRRSRDQGLAIIYISHRLDEIPLIADACMVMRDGRVVTRIDEGPFPTQVLVQTMTGRQWQPTPRQARFREDPRETVAIADAQVQIHRGQVLGLAGLLGNGTTASLHRLFGWRPERAASRRVRQAIERGRGFVPGERVRSLIPGLSVQDNIVLPHLDRYSRWSFRDEGRINAAVGRLMDLLDIRPKAPLMPVRQLSGGNQQKVAFAKWLTDELEILLLDEPTNGIDIGAKERLHQAVRDFVARGGTVLLSSSDLNELLDLSHTIAVLRQGAVEGFMQRDPDYGEARLRQMLGVG